MVKNSHSCSSFHLSPPLLGCHQDAPWMNEFPSCQQPSSADGAGTAEKQRDEKQRPGRLIYGNQVSLVTFEKILTFLSNTTNPTLCVSEAVTESNHQRSNLMYQEHGQLIDFEKRGLSIHLAKIFILQLPSTRAEGWSQGH